MARMKQASATHICTCSECQAQPDGKTVEEHRAINRVMGTLSEKSRRRFAGVLAMQWGHGGVQRVMAITGLSRNTIVRGKGDITQVSAVEARVDTDEEDEQRIRQVGGGRPPVEKNILASETD